MPAAYDDTLNQLHQARGGTGPSPHQFQFMKIISSSDPSAIGQKIGREGKLARWFGEGLSPGLAATPEAQALFASERAKRSAANITPVPAKPIPQPTAVNKTGSSDSKHGGTTPKKKKEEQGRGSVRRSLLLSGSGGKLG
jgi:hypothetical protein